MLEAEQFFIRAMFLRLTSASSYLGTDVLAASTVMISNEMHGYDTSSSSELDKAFRKPIYAAYLPQTIP